MLRQIASSSGGTFHRATSGGNEIDDVFKELASLEKTEFGVKQVTGFESRYQIPLAFGVLCFLVEVLLSERRGRVLRTLASFLGGRMKAGAAAVFLLCVIVPAAQAQTVRGHVKSGNKLYDKGQFGDAEAEYRKALEKDPTSAPGHFNLGDAHFKQDRYDEALRSYGSAAMNAKAPTDRSASYYNMGNTLFKANKYPEAIEAYKQALRNNPDDEDARYNLEVARNKLKQQQQQQKQQDQKQDKKQQQNQQQDQKDQQQNKQQDQQKNQDQQQQKQDQQQSQQDRTQQIQRKNQMNKEEAERMLEALKNNEKDLQKKLQKRQAVRIKVEKDW